MNKKIKPLNYYNIKKNSFIFSVNMHKKTAFTKDEHNKTLEINICLLEMSLYVRLLPEDLGRTRMLDVTRVFSSPNTNFKFTCRMVARPLVITTHTTHMPIAALAQLIWLHR